MTLTIDGFVVTGTPEEIDSFLKLYKSTSYTYTNIPPYIIQPLYHQTPDYMDPKKWVVTCEEGGSISCSNIKDKEGDCTHKQK